MPTYGYDPKVDYTKGINQAIANQDYRTAAVLEQQRNEKIRGEGLTQYQTTSHYADYLPRTEQINSGLDKLANQQPWQYDYQQDPSWQAYRKEYLREADRGTRDTLGAYAAQTGGMPSTAAVGAAQQAGNYYRAQLADKIPELMQNDYSRYIQGREADRADLNLLYNIDAQRAADSLERQQFAWQQQQAAISAAMDRWATMGYADSSVAAALGVPVGTSTQSAEYQRWQMDFQQQQAEQERENLAWQRQQNERGDAYDRAMTWIRLGIMPSDADLAAAGIDKTQAQRAVYLAQAGGASGVSGSSSGGTRGSSGSRRRSSGRDGDVDTTDSLRSANPATAGLYGAAAGAVGALHARQRSISNADRNKLFVYGQKNGPQALAAYMDANYKNAPNYWEVRKWLQEQLTNAQYSRSGGSAKPNLDVIK